MACSSYLLSKKDLCRALVTELRRTFTYVSVLGTDIRSTQMQVNRRLSNVGDGTDSERGFVFKLSRGGAFYEYSTDSLEGDPKQIAERITEQLRVDERYRTATISPAAVTDEPLVRDFERESDVDAYSEEELLTLSAELRDRVLASDEHILNAFVILRTLSVSKLFVSEHRTLTQSYAWVNGMMMVLYREGDGKMVQARTGANAHLIADVLRELPTKVDALVEKARHLAHATPITPGVYDVITAPSITGLIAHEAFGHGVEMDMFVKERALARSYMGKPVASPIVNMRDGAAAALSAASYFFDDDGVLAHDTQIIKDGVLVAGISDLISAGQLGTEPTGNGRRESYKRKAYSRMTNTFFEAGTDTLEDMIASIEHGYMLFETNNGMEDPKNWAIQCVAEYGIEIEHGKLTDRYVSPVVISGYVPDLLMSISMISDTVTIEGAGFCGKGYKEWVRVSDGGPALKVKVKLG
ncbi:MAG: TldD/PmbA family protein [Clostridia bacterium]|nr:TldD/PmbA family protein [Clostridia bacterium]